MRTEKSPVSKTSVSLISQMETQYNSNNVEELLRLLYEFIIAKERLSVLAAKALVKIVCRDHSNNNIKIALFELLDLVYEDRSNGKKLQESSYYISKVLTGKDIGKIEELSAKPTPRARTKKSADTALN